MTTAAITAAAVTLTAAALAYYCLPRHTTAPTSDGID
jgi:hypothetical protein